MDKTSQHLGQLLAAIKEGSATKAVSLLHNLEGSLPNIESQSWLHLAVNAPFNNRRLLRLFLEEGVSPETTDSSGTTVLHLSAKKGKVACIQELIRWNANVDSRDSKGQTPMHYLARNNHGSTVACMQHLLQAGASRDATTTMGFTPLHIASESGNVIAARALLTAGAGHSSIDARGRTPLHLASTTKMAETLLSAGANVTCEDGEGHTPLDRAIKHFPDIVPTLLGAGVAVQGDPQDRDLRVFFHLNIISGGQGSEVNLLKSMTLLGHQELLKHPLCETFMHLKWQRVSKFFYTRSLIFFAMIILFSSDLYFNLPLPLVDNSKLDSKYANQSEVNKGLEDIYRRFTMVGIPRVMSTVLLLVVTARAIVEMVTLKTQYWKNVERWVEVGFLLSAAVLLVYRDDERGWQRHLGAISVVLGWYKVTLLVGHMPAVGIYVHMFQAVAGRVLIFSLVYASLFVGFALSFHLVFSGYPFQRADNLIPKTLAMMVGELDYARLFGADDVRAPDYLDRTAQIVFVVFVVVITVVTTNLLVGLAVQDIHQLENKASVYRLALTVEQEANVEEILNMKLMACLLPHRFLNWLKLQCSLLGCLPHRPLPFLTTGYNATNYILSAWWISKLVGTQHLSNMSQYNIFVCPNHSETPGRVYDCLEENNMSIDSMEKSPDVARDTPYKLPNSLLENVKQMIKNGSYTKPCDVERLQEEEPEDYAEEDQLQDIRKSISFLSQVLQNRNIEDDL
nr:transient receptor potential channel pyrexia-like isoform X1 [Procambarus clarkii]XP_045622361.1 transient receptor potential channel pyrexia-like isoform X1 [Procambarus clarkii]